MNEFAKAIADVPTRDLATITGKSTQSAGNWKRGESLPDLGLIPTIAKRLGWPTDKLAGMVARDAAAKRA